MTRDELRTHQQVIESITSKYEPEIAHTIIHSDVPLLRHSLDSILAKES